MQYIIRGDFVKYLTSALGAVLDYINKFATTTSEKFTGDDSGAVLVMVIFYLIALILILILFKGVVRVIKDIFRTVFSRQKKKKAHVVSMDNGTTNFDSETTPTTVNGDENNKRIKNSDEISSIKSFGNKKYIDDLSRILEKINEFDNCAVQSQRISNTSIKYIAPFINEGSTVLSEKEKETIKKQVKGKDLNDLNDLLKQAKEEDLKLDDALKSLDKDLSKVVKERDKLIQEEAIAIDQHNNTVDALAALCDELTTKKSDLLEKHAELLNFIMNLGDKKAILLDSIKELKKEISSLPNKNKDFESLCDKEMKTFARSFQQKEEDLAGLKKNCSALSESISKVDEDISVMQQKQSKAATDKVFNIELISVLTAKINELEELEKERLAREEAERLERERLAKLEAERLAKEEAERLEKERQAKLEAERLEKERLAKEEAERIQREKEEELKKKEPESKNIITEANNDSDKELNEIKEQLKRQQQNSYSINYEDVSPETLEKMARAEQKKRIAAAKAAKQNGKAISEPESKVANNAIETKNEGISGASDKPTEAEKTDTIKNEAKPNDGVESQTDHIAELKQQWAEEEANKKRWAEEKARRKEEEQRRKKELAEMLSGDGASDNNK